MWTQIEKHCITGTYLYIGFSHILEMTGLKQFPAKSLTKDIWVVRIKKLSLFPAAILFLC